MGRWVIKFSSGPGYLYLPYYSVCMIRFSFLAVLFICSLSAATQQRDTIPALFKGEFVDDYGIKYHVTDTVWTQQPGIRYHILQWNEKEQWLLARNDAANPTAAGLYTRIDITRFSNMAPWTWGFCLSAYESATVNDALKVKTADRDTPRTGCNGFPFSRMKRVQEP